ncbi:MAG: adenylate/guanylate cyclase domain-containing protein [Deltaproteobacteria bacterium]|nr:adenylate/guanylate cyclase domain-containing protein [Deltaproteobacteria bacterium]
MKLSLSLKFAVIIALLVLSVAGSTAYVLVFRMQQSSERELVNRDRQLARVLARLRDGQRQLAFETLRPFVDVSDKVDIGLVYAIETDTAGKIRQGVLNPRLFSEMHPAFAKEMVKGRGEVLAGLLGGSIDRRGLIKQFALPVPHGKLLLGFDLLRIDRRVAEKTHMAFLVLGVGLLVGVFASLLLARHLGRPIRTLALAMKAVAAGDLDQTVQVSSRDELASLADSFNQMMRALRASDGQQNLTALYLSEAVSKRLAQSGDPLALAVEERAATVVSFRLAGFAKATMERSPREALALLNEYLSPLLDAVLAEDGVVFWLADARLQAVWGAFEPQVDAEERAAHAAFAALRGVEDEARRHKLSGLPTLSLRIGICSGQVALGNTGSAHRLAYRVVGEAVEVARRIEDYAEAGEVVVVASMAERLGDAVQANPYPPLELPDGREVALSRLGA